MVATGDMNWLVEVLRATAFYDAGEATPSAVNIWETATGRSPERVANQLAEGVEVAEGVFENNALSVSRRVGRVDIVLNVAPPPPNTRVDGFVAMGAFHTHLRRFSPAVTSWLRNSPSSTRLAFGSVLLMNAKDLRDGNEMMGRLLPDVHIDIDNAYDFFYQINRRRRSKSTNAVIINRLTKWSVAQGGSVDFIAGGGVGLQLSSERIFFASRLELDINTIGPPNHPIPKAKTVELFEELVTLGVEIANKGDMA